MTETERTLAEDITAAYEEVEAKESESVSSEKIETPPPKPTEEAMPLEEGTKESSSRLRDESGRFAKKEAKQDFSNDQSAREVTPEIKMDAPISWSAEEKQSFHEAPRKVQEAILRREVEREQFVNQKSDEAARALQYVEEIEQAVTPYRNVLERSGVPIGQAIRQFFAAQEFLDQNPLEGIKWLANSYGIDLSQLQEAESVDSVYDPRIQSLSQEVSNLRGYLSQVEQDRQAKFASMITGEVESFGQETDSRGAKVRPFFDNLRAEMATFVPLIRSQNPNFSNRDILQKAYEQAVWSNPSTREQEMRRIDSQKQEEAKRKAQSARFAGSSINGSPGGSNVNLPKDDLRALIEQVYDGQLS